VLSECMLLVSIVLCVLLMDEIECFEFWSFYVDVDIIRV
jgi:hypothetical protein